MKGLLVVLGLLAWAWFITNEETAAFVLGIVVTVLLLGTVLYDRARH